MGIKPLAIPEPGVSTPVKQSCFLLIAQAICVAVGLWMHSRQTDSSIYNTLEQCAWLQLEQCAQETARHLEELTIDEWRPGGIGLDRAQALRRQKRPTPGGVVLVDADWRVVLAEGDQEYQAQIVEGQVLSWNPESGGSETPSGLTRGELKLSESRHLTVCHPLKGGRGHLLAYHPISAIEAQTAVLTHPLVGINVVTLFWTVAVLAIGVWVILSRTQERSESRQASLLSNLLRQARSLVRTRDAVIFGLAKLAESRDGDTSEHLERISAYATTLAAALQGHPKYGIEATPAFVREIGISAALHDIGKVGIEDRILLKRGSLNAEERSRMRMHTVTGGQCLRKIEQRLGGSNFLQMARQIALAHHERWDGTGHPHGLAGEAIPLAARIVAIADVYDALVSKRVYKSAIPHAECVAMIRAQAGKSFDPELIEVWSGVEPEFRQIAVRYAATARPSGAVGNRELMSLGPGGDDEQETGPAAAEDVAVETLPEVSTVS